MAKRPKRLIAEQQQMLRRTSQKIVRASLRYASGTPLHIAAAEIGMMPSELMALAKDALSAEWAAWLREKREHT